MKREHLLENATFGTSDEIYHSFSFKNFSYSRSVSKVKGYVRITQDIVLALYH